MYNQSTFEELLVVAKPIINSLVNRSIGKAMLTENDRDDLINELQFELFKRRKYFLKEFANSSEFKGLIRYVVRLKLLNIIEKRAALKRHYNLETPVLINDFELENRLAYSPQNQLDLYMDIENILMKLSPEQVEICLSLKDGTIADVARDLKMKRSKVRSMLKNIRKVFSEEKLI
ncbi:MAG: hypothetical protein KJ737_12050 [Proteobacteria bacterium]|nr:hypothetical protein [Pseudomonadota bacterium]